MEHGELDLAGLLDLKGGARARDMLIRIGLAGRGRPKMYWNREANFGDALAPTIYSWVTGSRPIWVPGTWPKKIVGLGSNARWITSGDYVWGTGSIAEVPILLAPNVHVAAVRGPLTRQLMRGADVPEIYGDPALLLPKYFPRPQRGRQYAVGIVPHYVDRELVNTNDSSIAVIDVRDPWQQVVGTILSCEMIVSSSLHGLIVAEAYGIPAAWVRMSDRIIGGNFKFFDYMASTDRDLKPPVDWPHGDMAAIKKTLPPISFDTQPLLEAARGLPGNPTTGNCV